MTLDLYYAHRHLGSIVRSKLSCFAYLPDGTALGSFCDLDAAAAALLRRLEG